MRTHSLLLIGALAFGPLATVHRAQAQTPGTTTTTKAIQWLSMEEAQAKTKRVPKPLFVDVYTQWCGPCKMLDRNTFSDPKVADYVNKHFYPVKFDAESGAAVTFKGQKLSNPDFDPARAGGRNGTHQLTYAIANVNGRIAYPTIVYLDEEMNVLAPVQGYMTPEQLEPVLIFFGEGHYKKQDYQAFMATFKSRR